MTSYVFVLPTDVRSGGNCFCLVCARRGRCDDDMLCLRYSEDFPFKQLNLTPGKGVPFNTCAFEFFDDGRKYRSTETVYADDWFVLYRATDRRRAFNEYCIYHESLNQVISLLWK